MSWLKLHDARRWLFVAFLGLLACGPPWRVVCQAIPNPLLGQRSFVVMPIDFSTLSVGEKTEADYLADKDEGARNNWLGDKAGMNHEYSKSLTAEAGERGIVVQGPSARADWVVHPKISWVEPGFYAYVA